MKEERLTLGEVLRYNRIMENDIDIHVDGIDVCAYCGTKLTEEGEKHFAKALALPMNGCCVISDNDDDYDNILDDEGEYDAEHSALALAWELIYGAAGYIPCGLYNKWFEE